MACKEMDGLDGNHSMSRSLSLGALGSLARDSSSLGTSACHEGQSATTRIRIPRRYRYRPVGESSQHTCVESTHGPAKALRSSRRPRASRRSPCPLGRSRAGLTTGSIRGLPWYPLEPETESTHTRARLQPKRSKLGTESCSPFFNADWWATIPGTVIAKDS